MHQRTEATGEATAHKLERLRQMQSHDSPEQSQPVGAAAWAGRAEVTGAVREARRANPREAPTPL